MSRVLVVDDDTGIIETTGLLLRLAGHQVAVTKTAHEALHAVGEFKPEVALIDLKLGGTSGMDVLRVMRTLSPSTVCIMVTGFGDIQCAVEAMKLGAKDFVQKPLYDEDLVALVERANAKGAIAESGLFPLASAEAHSLHRWAEVVVRAISASKDPRTLHDWGRSVGSSTGAIRNWCRTARLSARRSLHFARILRAVARQQGSTIAPEYLLDIVDRRTLTKILLASGGTKERLPVNVADFLTNQRLIENADAIKAIREALAVHGLH